MNQERPPKPPPPSALRDAATVQAGDEQQAFSSHVAPIATALAVGLAFSFLPYCLWWYRTGHFQYIADLDNQYYLQLASRLYYSDLFSIRDVVVPAGATMYQALQFVPAVLLVRLFDLPVLDVNTVWHLWAAIALPLCFYLVFFHLLRRPWAAACCAIIMLVDCGISTTQPLVMQAIRFYQAAAGHLPALYDGQDLLSQWRIIDPALGLPILLLQVFFVGRAVEKRSTRSIPLAAGVTTALLFYIWFYYWTAAVGALTIGFVFDRDARRAYAAIVGIALALGAPAIVAGLITKPLLDPQALHRIGFFASVPRLGFFLLPKAGLLALVVTGLWIWRNPKHQGLYLWCLALAALALSNNHVVTGLDLRAGHWRGIWGTSLSMLVFVMAAELLHGTVRVSRSSMTIAISGLLLIEVITGATLRAVEVSRSINGKVVLDGYRTFMSQPLLARSGSLPVGAIVGGDEEFCDLSSIVRGTRPLAGYAAFLSLSLNDHQWETREALNAHLEGFSEQDFRKRAKSYARGYGWGQSADPQKSRAVEAEMMREFMTMEDASALEAAASNICYVALQAGHSEPAYLEHGWRLVEAEPYWRIWTRRNGCSK